LIADAGTWPSTTYPPISAVWHAARRSGTRNRWRTGPRPSRSGPRPRPPSREALAEKLSASHGLARLLASRSVSEDQVDEARNRQQVAASALQAVRVQRVEAEAAIAAARARVDQVRVQIEDSALLAPRNGRIQFRLAEPGEVLGAGGRVLTLIDLDDAYMTFFLPEREAGRVAIGAEARILLDAFADRPIGARISFVAEEAQFTPKAVETAHERQKLSFRLKAHIDVPEKYRAFAKPGLPGVCYVRLDPSAEWPAWLTAWTP
jgi:HlyD family secretion protein